MFCLSVSNGGSHDATGVRFYRLPPAWTLTLPAAAVLFLAMTLESAINYWRGIKAKWKGRVYVARP